MKKFLSGFLVFLISFCFSQKKVVDAKIITQDNDTLDVKIRVTVNMIDPTLIYGSSLNEKISIIVSGESIGESHAKTLRIRM